MVNLKSKAFESKLFNRLTRQSLSRAFRSIENGTLPSRAVRHSPKEKEILKTLLCFNEKTKENPTALLKKFNTVLQKKRNLFDSRIPEHRRCLENLWHLCQKVHGHHPIEWDLAIWLIEGTNGEALIIPDLTEIVLEWKRQNKTKYTNRLVKLLKPGVKGRGIGGAQKKWPIDRDNEIFARVHALVMRRKLSVSSASTIVAKEIGARSFKVLEQKYHTTLNKLLSYMPIRSIDKAVKASLLEQ